MSPTLRTALLGSATTAALCAFSSPAAAQSCTLDPAASPTSTVVCVEGSTTDTVMVGLPLVGDRELLLTTVDGDATVDITGMISGYGLALTNTLSGANSLVVTNAGGITVDAGNTPTVGGTAALDVTLVGDTSLDYSGDGDVLNLGTAGDGINVLNTGDGDVTLDVGGSVASAAGGSGILVDQAGVASTGNVTITTAEGDTIEADLAGVVATIDDAAATGDITIDNGADIASLTADDTLLIGVGASTEGTGDVTVNNTGTIGSETDSAAIGVFAQSLNAASTATVTATNGAGDVYADIGVGAANAGDGDTVVVTGGGSINGDTAGILTLVDGTGVTDITTGAGAVSAAAGSAIDVTATTGDVVIEANGDTMGSVSGIQAVSTGDQFIDANGFVSGDTVAGIHSDTTGDRTITIGADGEVVGGAEAILLTNTGTATIDNSGIIGDDSATLALNAAAAGDVTVNNLADGTINGTLTFGAGADVFDNAGTFNTEGTTDFGAGVDAFTNTGTLNLTGDTTFANLETLDLGGTTNLGGNTLTGTGAFTNTGTLNSDGGTLLGFTSLSNAGELFLTGTTTVPAVPFDNSGTVFSLDGDATLTGQTVFNNTGTIDMVDDAADDSLTIDSDFVGGAGSTLAVDVDEAAADMLIVNGDISGTTTVDANILASGALVNGGVQVVDGAGASTDGAFTLGDVTGGSALVDYAVVQDGSDYYLDAALTPAGFRPLTLASMAPDFWYPSADEVIANLAVPYKGSGIGFWADGYVSREKYGDRDADYSIGGVNYSVDQRIKMGHMGLQAGVDFGMSDTGRVGVTAGYSRHNGRDGTDIEAKGWNVGAYGAFGGVTGFHGEVLAKYDRYKVDFDDGIFDAFNPKVKAFGIDGSVGYRIPMGGENSSLDLAAGLSHVTSKIDDIDAYGLNYDYDRVKSTRGRASARYNLGGDIQPYVQGTVYHEFSDAGRVALFDGVNTYDLTTAKRGTWGRIEAGVGGSPNRFPSFGAWADLGDVKGIGARLGMRFGGSADVAPPPPPPPAPVAEPAPAPATQTCYDGSVILATDTCPLPPAPPPPPPAPERG